MRKTIQLLSVVFAGLFLLAAVMQYNDPDGWVWMLVYSSAAVLSLLYFLERFSQPAAALFIGVFLLWAGWLAWRVFAIKSIVTPMQLYHDEQGREMVGLIILAGWLLLMFVSDRHFKSQ